MNEKELRKELIKHYERCDLCPWGCGVNRYKERGICLLGSAANIFYEGILYGDELCIIPTYGIFFAGCNLRCVFCEYGEYQEKPDCIYDKKLEDLKIKLKRRDYKSISFIGGEPSLNPLAIAEILSHDEIIDAKKILNTNLYFSKCNMEILNEMIDIYIADIHFGNNICAERFAGAINYYDIIMDNINYIYHCSSKELIIRHLLLPGHLDCCFKVIVEALSKNGVINNFSLLTNYHPWYRAHYFDDINRMISAEEATEAKEILIKYGIKMIGDKEINTWKGTGSSVEDEDNEIIIDSEGRIIIPYLTKEMVLFAEGLVPEDDKIKKIKKLITKG